jgi:DNA-binding transcriptional regulator YdaS (Cro superfamily)
MKNILEKDDENRKGRKRLFLSDGIGQRITASAVLVGGKRKLAKMLSISETQLHRIISGSSHTKVEVAAEISKATGVSLNWLITGEGEMLGQATPQATKQDQAPSTEKQACEIPDFLQKKVVDSMIKYELIKEEWRTSIQYFTAIYNEVAKTPGTDQDIDEAVIKYLLNYYRSHLAIIDHERELGAMREEMEPLRNHIIDKIESLEVELARTGNNRR